MHYIFTELGFTDDICDPICENTAYEISRKCIKNALKNALTTHYNVFQPVGNAFQRAEIIFECDGNVHQCVEQRIANFIKLMCCD